MGFWIFMTACNLMLPVLMIAIGKIFTTHPPRTVNGIYGYRTSMSMKNQDTWDFAQAYFAKSWQKTGWVMLPLALIVMLFVIGGSEEVVGIVGGIEMTAELVVLIVSIVPVERALKRNFDRAGNKR